MFSHNGAFGGLFQTQTPEGSACQLGHHKEIAGMAISLLLTGIYLFSRFALLKTGVEGGICKG